jgi:hypothetical protein
LDQAVDIRGQRLAFDWNDADRIGALCRDSRMTDAVVTSRLRSVAKGCGDNP